MVYASAFAGGGSGSGSETGIGAGSSASGDHGGVTMGTGTAAPNGLVLGPDADETAGTPAI